jgi:hypothetical protein
LTLGALEQTRSASWSWEKALVVALVLTVVAMGLVAGTPAPARADSVDCVLSILAGVVAIGGFVFALYVAMDGSVQAGWGLVIASNALFISAAGYMHACVGSTLPGFTGGGGGGGGAW